MRATDGQMAFGGKVDGLAALQALHLRVGVPAGWRRLGAESLFTLFYGDIHKFVRAKQQRPEVDGLYLQEIH